jgi:hypothetical protein
MEDTKTQQPPRKEAIATSPGNSLYRCLRLPAVLIDDGLMS